jgi:hypothetical protein
MHTTFERVDNERVVHIPHSKIGKECIENLSRTRMFSHNVVLPLEPKNAPPDISELQGKLAKYCLENKALLAALLFHEMPKVSLKDEDVGEKGKKSKSSIQIEFRMKRRVRPIIFCPIYLVAKLLRFLGPYTNKIRNSEIVYRVKCVYY